MKPSPESIAPVVEENTARISTMISPTAEKALVYAAIQDNRKPAALLRVIVHQWAKENPAPEGFTIPDAK